MNEDDLTATAVSAARRHNAFTDLHPDHTVRVSRAPDLTDAVVLRFITDEVFELRFDAEFCSIDFAYTDPDKLELVDELIDRALDYLDGKCFTVERRQADIVFSRNLEFPDGTLVGGRVPLLQRVQALIRRGHRTQDKRPARS